MTFDELRRELFSDRDPMVVVYHIGGEWVAVMPGTNPVVKGLAATLGGAIDALVQNVLSAAICAARPSPCSAPHQSTEKRKRRSS